jgi:hypothetical protein
MPAFMYACIYVYYKYAREPCAGSCVGCVCGAENIYTYIHTYMHAYKQTCIPAYMHTYTYIHA